MKGISAKQQFILDYIKKTIVERGYPPSVREICEAAGLTSTSSGFAYLTALEKKGYIRRKPGQSRTIEILEDNFYGGKQDMLQIPLVGRVAAGQPMLATQNIESYFPMPAEELKTGGRPVYMLEVHGDSMVNIGIMDGDRVIVAEADTAENGEIVVALVDDSATVKRFYKEDGFYRLQPENDTMDPIIVKECSVMGKVIGVLRLYR